MANLSRQEHLLFWFGFRNRQRRRCRVYLATPRLLRVASPSQEVRGLFIPKTRDIYIDAAQPRADQDETLLHEVLHACLDGHAEEGGEVLSDMHEERAIGLISPRLLPILRRAAAHAWPERPDAAESFERFARGPAR